MKSKSILTDLILFKMPVGMTSFEDVPLVNRDEELERILGQITKQTEDTVWKRSVGQEHRISLSYGGCVGLGRHDWERKSIIGCNLP